METGRVDDRENRRRKHLTREGEDGAQYHFVSVQFLPVSTGLVFHKRSTVLGGPLDFGQGIKRIPREVAAPGQSTILTP